MKFLIEGKKILFEFAGNSGYPSSSYRVKITKTWGEIKGKSDFPYWYSVIWRFFIFALFAIAKKNR